MQQNARRYRGSAPRGAPRFPHFLRAEEDSRGPNSVAGWRSRRAPADSVLPGRPPREARREQPRRPNPPPRWRRGAAQVARVASVSITHRGSDDGGSRAPGAAGPSVEGTIVQDDLGAMLSVLPEDIRGTVESHPQRGSLLEIVLDLGRRPEARFQGQPGGEFLREAEITREDLEAAGETPRRPSPAGPAPPCRCHPRGPIPPPLPRVGPQRRRWDSSAGTTARASRAPSTASRRSATAAARSSASRAASGAP